MWVSVLRKKPPRDQRFKDISVDVEIRRPNDMIVEGFYNYQRKEWYFYKSNKPRQIDEVKLLSWRLIKGVTGKE